MSVTLDKPRAVTHYVQTINGGDHELVMTGVPVKVTADLVTYLITTIRGATSGKIYTERFPHLIGAVMVGGRDDVILWR